MKTAYPEKDGPYYWGDIELSYKCDTLNPDTNQRCTSKKASVYRMDRGDSIAFARCTACGEELQQFTPDEFVRLSAGLKGDLTQDHGELPTGESPYE